MSDISMGTIYDINKLAVSKEKPLTNKEIDEKLKAVIEFCYDTNNTYYMLLNREKYDFTLFDFEDKDSATISYRLIYEDLKDCLQNRGKIMSIDLTRNKDAVEIWISIGDESLVYYFFPYDQGVIK